MYVFDMSDPLRGFPSSDLIRHRPLECTTDLGLASRMGSGPKVPAIKVLVFGKTANHDLGNSSAIRVPEQS